MSPKIWRHLSICPKVGPNSHNGASRICSCWIAGTKYMSPHVGEPGQGKAWSLQSKPPSWTYSSAPYSSPLFSNPLITSLPFAFCLCTTYCRINLPQSVLLLVLVCIDQHAHQCHQPFAIASTDAAWAVLRSVLRYCVISSLISTMGNLTLIQIAIAYLRWAGNKNYSMMVGKEGR